MPTCSIANLLLSIRMLELEKNNNTLNPEKASLKQKTVTTEYLAKAYKQVLAKGHTNLFNFELPLIDENAGHREEYQNTSSGKCIFEAKTGQFRAESKNFRDYHGQWCPSPKLHTRYKTPLPWEVPTTQPLRELSTDTMYPWPIWHHRQSLEVYLAHALTCPKWMELKTLRMLAHIC